MKHEQRVHIERLAVFISETAKQYPDSEVVSTGTGYRNGKWEFILILRHDGQDIVTSIPCDVHTDTQRQKCYYSMEEQINDCYSFLGLNRKDAHKMNEQEMEDASQELSKHFEWIAHPRCYQAVPRHIETGALIGGWEKGKGD